MKKLSLKTLTTSFFSIFLIILTSSHSNSEEDSIKDIVTELYNNYEAVDRELKELKGLAETTNKNSSSIGFTLGIKKDTDIEFVSIDIDKGGIPFASHLYSERDNKALGYGGRHLLYKGKLDKGSHSFVLYYIYKGKRGTVKSKATWKMSMPSKPTYLELLFKEKDGKIKVIPRKTTERK